MHRPEYNLSEVAMSLRSRRAGLVLLLMFSAATLAAQSRVNPTVKIRPGAAAPVPVECEEGVAPQPMLRADLRDLVQEPDRAADMVPPPSRDLRSSLAAAQAAARNNDRESFRQALAASKAMLVNYPPGGEKNAATEVIAIYDDLDRVWDYQFSSPVGSFFDASVQGGNLLSTLQKYRGYDEYVRRQIYTDANGVRLYPTRESRDFLAREAGERLARLGIRDAVAQRPQPQPQPQLQPRVVTERSQPAPPSKPATVTQPAVSKAVPKPAARSTSSTPKRKPARSTTRRAAAKVEPVSEPPKSEPSDDPDPGPSPSIVATPSTSAPTATETTATAAMSETTMTDTAAAVDTAVATAPVDATDAQRAQTRTRSVILPIILILIGVGVLIVLFRASS